MQITGQLGPAGLTALPALGRTPQKKVQTPQREMLTDRVSISPEGRAALEQEGPRVTKTEKGYELHFSNVGQLDQTLAQGYFQVDDQKIALTDQMRQTLERTGARMQKQNEKLSAIQMAQHNAQVAREQGEAMGDAAGETAKMLEIYRRIASGGKVPHQDEQKLMEYSKELYMMAQSAAMLAKNHEEYDSLLEDEKPTDTQPQSDSPAEAAPAASPAFSVELAV